MNLSHLCFSPVFRLVSTHRGISNSVGHDIVIAGGGLVGSAMAAAVASNPALGDKRVLLLEGAQPKVFAPSKEYNNRVVALNNATKNLFERLGVWGDIEAVRCKGVRGMHVWDERGDANLVTFEADAGKNHFYIAENDLVVHVLGERLKTLSSQVEVMYGANLDKCQFDKEKKIMKLSFKSNERLETKLLIGADGFNSTVRAAMGRSTRYLSKSYDQMGVVGVIRLDSATNDFAWQRFLPAGRGPIAILPLSPDRSSLVWTLDTTKAQEKLKMPPEQLLTDLLDNLGSLPRSLTSSFPRLLSISEVAGFPLGLGHSSRYCQEGMVLVGDAAHRVHPLAGQGVNLGFGDVDCLARCLEDSVLAGEKFPSYPSLLRYETERQRHNVPMLLGIDFLQQVYGWSDNTVVGMARNFGVGFVQSSPILKKFLSNFAA